MYRISTKTHGILDYVVGAAIAVLPQMIRCTRPTQAILHTAGIGAAAYSVLTDYERGVVKALPMQAHLTMDAMSGLGLMTAAMVLSDERPEVRAMLAGIGAFEIAVASMTETEAYAEGQSASTAERIAEYVSR